MTKIGIVVPVYNGEKALVSQCVESLVKQTYEDISIVIVNDGSDPYMKEHCGFLAGTDPRIRLVHHERNLGLPAARNTGMDALEDAGWVTFVDSDDWLEPDACETLAAYLDGAAERPDIVIFSGFRNYRDLEIRCAPVYENGTVFDTYDKRCELQRRALRYVLRDYPRKALNLDSACWRFISLSFLRSKGIRFDDLKYREDGLFFFHTTEYAERIVFLDKNLYHYRSTGSSMVNTYRPNADAEHRAYMDKVIEFIEKHNKDGGFAEDLYYAAFLSMQICITQKFFNHGNKGNYLSKRRECVRYFSRQPYASAMDRIRISALRREHLIKALLIKCRMYKSVVILRDAFNLIRRKSTFGR